MFNPAQNPAARSATLAPSCHRARFPILDRARRSGCAVDSEFPSLNAAGGMNGPSDHNRKEIWLGQEISSGTSGAHKTNLNQLALTPLDGSWFVGHEPCTGTRRHLQEYYSVTTRLATSENGQLTEQEVADGITLVLTKCRGQLERVPAASNFSFKGGAPTPKFY